MSTSHDGVFTGGKRGRRERALKRLRIQLPVLVKQKTDVVAELKKDKLQSAFAPNLPELLEKNIQRIKKEIITLEDILSGKKKAVLDEKGKEVIEVPKEKWWIDIHQIHLSYVKNSERRKNKGKSKKKMKKVRNTTFVKSVVLQPGMMQAYRDGKMGISPRNHSFRARKEEPSYLT